MSIVIGSAKAQPAPAIPDNPISYARRTLLMGVFGVVVLFGGFIVWSVVANLSSAAVAPGMVVVDTNRKVIQHLEGGIVAEILVKDGDVVQAGQTLIRLDPTRAESQSEQLRMQLFSLLANEARLLAERESRRVIPFAKELLDARTDARVEEFIQGQEALFLSRNRAIEGQIDLLRQQIAQTEQQANGVQAQLVSGDEQMALIDQELQGVRELLEKGLERRPRLLALERAKSQLVGAKADAQSNLARLRERVAELRLQMVDVQNRRQAEVAQQLRDVQTQLADLRERLRAADDALARIDIRSPIAGRVVNNRVHTVGGVVTSSQPLMEVVPAQDKLVIEARVNPVDIDTVVPGLKTNIHLSAYKTRLMPNITGHVVSVSADVIQDQRTGMSFYLARVEADAGQLEELRDVQLYPGMPAEVQIVTGERTPLDYLVSPLAGTMRRAFREE